MLFLLFPCISQVSMCEGKQADIIIKLVACTIEAQDEHTRTTGLPFRERVWDPVTLADDRVVWEGRQYRVRIYQSTGGRWLGSMDNIEMISIHIDVGEQRGSFVSHSNASMRTGSLDG